MFTQKSHVTDGALKEQSSQHSHLSSERTHIGRSLVHIVDFTQPSINDLKKVVE